MSDPPDVVEFCRFMRPRLVGTLTLLCGNAEVAEELTQETLARLWVNWSKLHRPTAQRADAWAYRVAINLANSWWRRLAAERRARARLAMLAPANPPGPDLAEAHAIRQAVAALPRRQRTALVLRYYADLPVGEVAALMGCSPGTIKSLTNRAISALRAADQQHSIQEVGNDA
jgi:RNA polymerase sigma-70 factor (sigma-E family)